MIEIKEPITITQIAGLFERLDATKHADALQFLAQFETFKSGYLVAKAEAEISRRKYAPGFNIFNFFGVRRMEGFHSDFIAYLLNPRQSHGQGHLFLESFLQVLKRSHPDLPVSDAPIHHGVWLLEREVITRNGNLDIVLRNPSLGAIYIFENKIDAGEQPDQITRYGAYLARLAHDHPYQGLFFLTIQGNRALTAGDTPYYPIAYRHEIHAWLESALPEIQAMTVREIVRQYLDLIHKL